MVRQLTVISSMATRQILRDLASAYERQTGIQVAVKSMGGVEAAKLIRAGEPADLIVLAAKVTGQLEAEGHILPGSRADFARSGIAIAIRAGAARPDIGDEEGVKRAILDAPKICYSSGPSGDHLKTLWDKWGIASAMADRAVQAPPGVPVATFVARGEADLGFQQLSELLDQPGIEVLGPLPDEIQSETIFTIGVSSTCAAADEARALTGYLTSPGVDAVKVRHGMRPV